MKIRKLHAGERDMRDFLKGLEYEILQETKENIEYTGIEYDSRKIQEGNIFVALEGNVVDGHNYIEQAVKNGAKCILVSKNIANKFPVKYILIKELRKKLGIIASNFYGWPQNKLKLIGITGTNGKTTSTYLLESILGEEKTARIGTVEYKVGNEIIEATNTTPESLDIIKICKKAIEKNMEYLVMEISSHALELGRVSMLKFDVVGFTNLTLDHLDYHQNMENYFQAKRKLYTMLKENCLTNCVTNIDDCYGERLFKEFGGTSYSLNKEADIEGKILEFHTDGQLVEISINKEIERLKIALLGRYNLYNVLGII